MAGKRPGDQAGQEDDRELEALGLVDGQDARPRPRRGRGRPSAGRRPPRSGSGGGARRTPRGRRRGAPTGRGRCRRTGRRSRAPPRPRRSPSPRAGEPARVPQERVQDLAGRPLVGQRRVRAQVGDEPRPRVAASPGESRRMPGWRSELLEDLPDAAVAAARGVHDRRQVLAAEAVELRRGEGVHVDARRPEVGDGAQERRAGAAPPAAHTARTCPRTATGSRRG